MQAFGGHLASNSASATTCATKTSCVAPSPTRFGARHGCDQSFRSTPRTRQHFGYPEQLEWKTIAESYEQGESAVSPKMTHICLHVESLDECARFYERYCNLNVVRDQSREGEGSVYMAGPGRETEIVFQFMSGGQSLRLPDSDNRHFGFAVESKQAVDEVAGKARADGCLYWEPDEYIPGAYLCAVKDPNGNCLEFSFEHPMPPP